MLELEEGEINCKCEKEKEGKMLDEENEKKKL